MHSDFWCCGSNGVNKLNYEEMGIWVLSQNRPCPDQIVLQNHHKQSPVFLDQAPHLIFVCWLELDRISLGQRISLFQLAYLSMHHSKWVEAGAFPGVDLCRPWESTSRQKKALYRES